MWFIWVTWSFALSGQSAFCYGCYDYQSIKVTALELVGDTEIHVKHSTVYDVPLQDFMSLDVNSASRRKLSKLHNIWFFPSSV